MGCVNSLDGAVRTLAQAATSAGLEVPDGVPLSAGNAMNTALRGDEFDQNTIKPFPVSYLFSKSSVRNRFTYQGPVNQTMQPLIVTGDSKEAPNIFLVEETVASQTGVQPRVGVYNDSPDKHFVVQFEVSIAESSRGTVAAFGAGREQESASADGRRVVKFEVDVAAQATEWAAVVNGVQRTVADTDGNGVADQDTAATIVRTLSVKQTDAVRVPRSLLEQREKTVAEAKRVVATETEYMRGCEGRAKRKETDTYASQQFARICAQEKIKFVDTTFPPSDQSVGTGESFPWRRPTQYLTDAQKDQIRLFRDVSSKDIHQGLLGDCWLLCSCAALASLPSKVQRLFRHPQRAEYGKLERQQGAYTVTINKDGWWTTTVVDDYLPVDQIECIAPSFAHNSNDPCELWVPLVEKTFAKLYGSYAAVAEGEALHGLQNLTGYPSVRLDSAHWKRAAGIIRSMPSGSLPGPDVFTMFSELLRLHEGKALCIITTEGVDTTAYSGAQKSGDANGKAMADRFNQAGLPMGHAFTVLDVRCFPDHGRRAQIPFLESNQVVPNDSLCLVQVLNPWGSGYEWTGAWSDNDDHWRQFPNVASTLKPENKADGTFWMEWTDILRYFDGGGASLIKRDWHDYRVKTSFSASNLTISNTCLEVVVQKGKKVRGFATVSQADDRGSNQRRELVNVALSVGRVAVTKGPNAVSAENISVMDKIVASGAAQQGGNDVVVQCKPDLYATLNALQPVTHGSFVGARDVSLAYLFDATNATEETESFFVIPRAHSSIADARSFVLGLLLEQQVGPNSAVKDVKFVQFGANLFQGESNNVVIHKNDLNSFASVAAESQYTSEIGIPQLSKRGFGLADLK